MNKLFVAGCSVSDYTDVNEVYGEHLAKKLDMNYVHEAVSCGSNWRIWRRIVDHILRGNLTKDDLLIVQYTDTDRCEFWSRHHYEHILPKKETKPQYLREKHHNYGEIIRFKLNSYTWQVIPEEVELFKLYENNFVNDEFNFEVTNTQHIMFQALLKEYNIPTIFFGIYSNYYYKRLKILPHFKESYFNINEIVMGKKNEYLIENDNYHFNDKGHKYVAEKLHEHIKKWIL